MTEEDNKKERKCYFCNETMENRCTVNNGFGNSFIFMPTDTSSHFECYIKHCVKEIMVKE